MKLLLCPHCADVKKLQMYETVCECGKCSGRYLSDGWHAEVKGPQVQVLGINNNSLRRAVNGMRSDAFDAWLFQRDKPSRVTWIDE